MKQEEITTEAWSAFFCVLWFRIPVCVTWNFSKWERRDLAPQIEEEDDSGLWSARAAWVGRERGMIFFKRENLG